VSRPRNNRYFAGSWGKRIGVSACLVWGSKTAFRHACSDEEVSKKLMTLCKRRYADTPTRRYAFPASPASVLVLAASLLLGACAATDTGKKDDPVLFGGAGGGNDGGGVTSGMSFRW